MSSTKTLRGDFLQTGNPDKLDRTKLLNWFKSLLCGLHQDVTVTLSDNSGNETDCIIILNQSTKKGMKIFFEGDLGIRMETFTDRPAVHELGEEFSDLQKRTWSDVRGILSEIPYFNLLHHYID